jgi:hypothetical protein
MEISSFTWPRAKCVMNVSVHWYDVTTWTMRTLENGKIHPCSSSILPAFSLWEQNTTISFFHASMISSPGAPWTRSFVQKGYLCLQCHVILFVLNSLFNVLTWFAKNLLDDFRAVRPILALKWLRLSTRSAHGSPHAHSPRPTIINLASCDCVNNVRRHPISCGVLRLFKFSCRTNRVKLPNSIKRRKNVKGVLVCLFGSFSSIHRPSG